LTNLFDDFHLFGPEDRVPQLIDVLAQNLPDHAGMVIASREAPKLSLGRLRSQGELSDLREPDLVFSFDELSDLMCNWNLKTSEATLHQVHRSTEGWPAGLVLMENHLRSSDEIPDLFANRQIQHNVYDYLAEEVLQALPEETQDFLKRVSLVDPMEPSVCSAALRIESAGRMLAEVERANLFTTSLDEIDAYRFHPLFRDFLLSYFRREYGEEVNKLRIDFAHAFQQAGKKREAIQQFLNADCYSEAIELIEEIGEEMLSRVEYKNLEAWFACLAPANFTPVLKMLHAYSLISRGKYYQALNSFKSTESELKAEDLYLKCRLAMGMAECHRELGESEKGIEVLLPFLGNDSLEPALKLEVVYRLSGCYLVKFDLEGIHACNEIANKISRQQNLSAPSYKFLIAVQCLREGDFPTAETLHKKMIEKSNYSGSQCLLMNNQASCLMMVGKYEEALTLANKCIERMKKLGEIKMLPAALDTLGCLLVALEKQSQGLDTLNDALEDLSEIEHKRTDQQAGIICHLGTNARRQANYARAIECHKRTISIAESSNELYEMAMGWANLGCDLTRKKLYYQAGTAFRKSMKLAVKYNLRYVKTFIEFGSAWLANMQNNEKNEIKYLCSTLKRARKYQHNHFIIQEGKISMPLFSTALEHNIEVDYVCWILEKIGPESLSAFEPVLGHQDSSVRAKIAASVGNIGTNNAITLLRRMRYDPDEHVAEIVRNSLHILRKSMNSPLELLTSREAEVLKWLSNGMSNCQIASKLFITERTVKTHVAKIFRKLGFTNRIDAALYFKQFEEDDPQEA
ncbi:MAG: LuxR C-terminal-related transcriptional regulator, partial [Actinobacteria bacterium]|nr:LuxR C-terminal-related transcriptional regulator [Actinomycetota bacterium]